MTPMVQKYEPVKEDQNDAEVYDQFEGSSVLVKVGDRDELP